MTETQNTSPARRTPHWLMLIASFWPVTQLIISIGLVVTALLWLLKHPGNSEHVKATDASKSVPAVEVTADGTIRVRQDSPLAERLTRRLHSVTALETNDPLLKVTGLVIASRRPGQSDEPDFWQFNTPELLTTYSDWERAEVDLQFNRSQLDQVRELTKVTEAGLQQSIARMEKLVQSGTETARDLAALQTQLLQTQVQSRKDIYQSEVAIKTAERALATLRLQLARSGLDPQWMRTATADLDVLSAEVPESLLSRVRRGQSAYARFFGLPNEEFTGTVSTVSPVLSTEQRTQRVLLILNDPQDRLRPGMFAEVGLGTDPRTVIRVPAAAVVHVGRDDFVLELTLEKSDPNATDDIAGIASNPSMHLRVAQVRIASTIDGTVEIESGLAEGMTIVGDDAVLLKPLVIQSLSSRSNDSAPISPNSAVLPTGGQR